ncbi:ribonuclease H-like domain-containing protein [Tanacetum coccineum]
MHVDFWNICSDEKCRVAWSKSKSIQNDLKCTDIAKISRKQSKPDKHGHGNGIECAKAGRMLSKGCYQVLDLVEYDEIKEVAEVYLMQQLKASLLYQTQKGYIKAMAGVDSLSFDDLYNNLRVFESDVKGSTTSSSNTQNVAFVSENTSNTNDVSTTYGISNSYSHNSQYEHTSSYSLLANQSSCPQLGHEDLEQLNEFNLEEMDLKWKVAMISMRMKKFYKKTDRKQQFNAKEPVGFDKTKVECYSCHKTGHFAKECKSKGNQDSRRRDT